MRSANCSLSNCPWKYRHPIGLLDQIAADIGVGDARGVAQQILDVDRPVRRLELEDVAATLRLGIDAGLNLGERRNVFGYGICQCQSALIDEHHRRARLVIGLVIECSANSVSGVIGRLVARSRTPKHLR